MLRLKRICYRGGIAEFEIPASWIEEYEPSGGATFYEDRPDSGTLRLSVLSFTSDGKQASTATIAKLIAQDGYSALPGGLAISEAVKSAVENGEELIIRYWNVAIPVEQSSIRLAVFSYTSLASQASDPCLQGEIALLDRSIRAAQFSREPGVSGDYEHSKTY